MVCFKYISQIYVCEMFEFFIMYQSWQVKLDFDAEQSYWVENERG